MNLYDTLRKYNTNICLAIVSKYYRGLDTGKTHNYKLNPAFYKYYLLRLFFTFFELLFSIRKVRSFKPGLTGSKKILLRLFGFEHFLLPNLLPLLNYEEILQKEIDLSSPENSIVSIIIPVHNHLDFTYNCLQSIHNTCGGINYEIIVVDDKSEPTTADYLINNVKGIKYIRNEINLGFLQSCIKGIACSTSKYICLLNNDTQVLPKWLESLIKTIELSEDIGCVGSKLVYPHGLLQEAGGIIFKDASGANYGRNDRPDRPRYNYLREVDYCSGASILFRRADYEIIGGLDTRFSPAYYEDTDLCFSFRHILKKKVMYQPLSEVVHFEGISSGKETKEGSVKFNQTINKGKFLKKWEDILSEYTEPRDIDVASRRLNLRKTAMFIDSNLPFYDRDSGSRRIYSLIKLLKSDFHIIFIPADGGKPEPYYSELVYYGIEVFYHFQDRSFMRKEIDHVLSQVDYLWISRPEVNQKYKALKKASPNIKWIFDTVDLTYLRLERSLKFSKADKKLISKIKYYRETEINLARSADLTIAITDDELEELSKNGVSNISVVPNVHEPNRENGKPFIERSGLLFIGGYKHQPNVDAAFWLLKHIMPLVWNDLPELKVTLLGSDPSEELLSMANDKIIIPGYIHDVSYYFNSSRVFVAPLRFGAGMKGKIGQSLEYKLPTVTTPIGAEGMNLIHGKHAVIASNVNEFVSGILNLYTDEALWTTIQANSYEALVEYHPDRIKEKIKSEVFND